MTTAKAPTLGTEGFHNMAHEDDPKRRILDKLQGIVPLTLGAKVCLATYIRPEKTAGGIYRPETNVREDIYQGKLGLVIALGPIAFKDGKDAEFGGVVPKLHDWVVFSSAHGAAFSLMGVHCRFMDDVLVQAIVNNPDSVY